MLKRLFSKEDKKTLIFVCAAFFAFAILIYLFPYSGDDWAWGSGIGIERLKSFFKAYNGRYAGNLLVMALTRSKLLNIVLTGASLVAVCLLPKAYSGTKKLSSLLLAFALFMLTPKSVWVQSVVWTAGFTNYIPPILLTMTYLVIVRNIFADEKPVYSKAVPFLTALIGFVASLFMENITLYGVVLSVGVIAFTLMKHKKLCAAHVANLLGSVAGTVFMFSNSAYGIIASADDGYRSTALSEGLLETVESHIKTINDLFFVNNIVMLTVITVLSVALTYLFMKKQQKKSMQLLACVSVAVNIICLVLIYSKKLFSHWLVNINIAEASTVTDYFIFLVAVVYFLSLCITVAVCMEEMNRMFAALFVLVSVPVLIAPLLVVNPIGPRCFFPPYFLCIVLCVCLYDYVSQNIRAEKAFECSAGTAFAAVGAAMFIFMLSIYMPIHKYDIRRNEYALIQSQLGYEKITVCKLPYTSYVWTGDPSHAPWDERYKLFYGIDENAEFELLSYSEFDKWAEKFDKEVKK